MNKENLIRLIQQSTSIHLYIAQSNPQDKIENIPTGELNDYSVHPDGTLELWYNTGYEI